jgi:hypothetical protein
MQTSDADVRRQLSDVSYCPGTLVRGRQATTQRERQKLTH